MTAVKTQVEFDAVSGHYTFSAPLLRHALAGVREQLGPDAIILGQQRQGRQIVVTACSEADYRPVTEPEETVAQIPEVSVSESLAGDEDPAVLVKSDTPSAPAHDHVVPTQAGKEPAVGEEQVIIADRTARGYGYVAATRIGVEQPLEGFRRHLIEDLRFTQPSVEGLSGCWRVVGPSGCGKTTFLLQLLVARVRACGVGSVEVVTSQAARLAANETLQLGCEALGVRYTELARETLGSYFSQPLTARLVLVDSHCGQAHVLPGVSDLLVVSAQLGPAALRHALNLPAAEFDLVLTHLDQPFDADAVLSALVDWQASPAWLVDSDLVDRPLQVASSDGVFRQFFGAGSQDERASTRSRRFSASA